MYCPVHMLKIHILAGLEKEIPNLKDLKKIINMCGLLLTCDDSESSPARLTMLEYVM